MLKPTVQTMKGRASVRRGRDRGRARTAEEMMVEGSQKLEPS